MIASPHQASNREVLDAWTRALRLTAAIEQTPQRLLADVIDDVARDRGACPALISDDGDLSYVVLVDRINRYSRWARAQGIAKGQVVGLLMQNQPDYLAIWLGITRIGGVVALLNTDISETALDHCLDLVDPSHVIASVDLCPAVQQSQARTSLSFGLWAHGCDATGLDRIDAAIATIPGAPLSAPERVAVDISDRALLIFTSGTTGLPKAANVSHRRVLTWSFWFAGLMDITPADRMYDCLPMHHSVGGVVAIGSLLVSGGSVVLRRRFSARDFWTDVVGHKCTLVQYIGELCRYLLNTPPCAAETRHQIRICCGNGLRADIWEAFQARFQIPRILEFYAASEGSFSLVNLEGKPGAIGRVPLFLRHRFPAEIVQFDMDRQEPRRDQTGRCIRCADDEIGEAIGRLDPRSGGGTNFEGYSSPDDTERKVLRDVFVTGDAWFRTGDLMRRDRANFFYFVDRIGDTFRWKGENVSTSQVAAVLNTCPGVAEAAVYGVTIPGADGRAGMAALVITAEFDLRALEALITRQLPRFSRPLFLRLQGSIEATATFKQQTQRLQRDGYDLSRCDDPVLVYDRYIEQFRNLTQADLDRIAYGLMVP
jgi:fatty-acyl-CoA synthase